MILSIVSRWRGAGKDRACDLIEENYQSVDKISMIGALRGAINHLTTAADQAAKHEPIPQFGVSYIDIINAVSASLYGLHPELAVYISKESIASSVRLGRHVVIPDVRRKREFLWMGKLAAEFDTRHEVVEIVPHFAAKPDVWKEGTEICGEAAWPTHRYVIYNDGTDNFDNRIMELGQELLG